MEECTVELLSAMICADLNLNVEPRPDHARYIASWLEVLRSDKCAIFTAASKAQQIADWTRRSRRTLTTRSGAPRRRPPAADVCSVLPASVDRLLAEECLDQRTLLSRAVRTLRDHVLEHSLHAPQIGDLRPHVIKMRDSNGARLGTRPIALVDEAE